MSKRHFLLNGNSYDKRALLERMCKYGVARWGVDEVLQIARLEAEIAELRALDEHLRRAVKTRRKRIEELRHQSPTLQQKQWDNLRVARAVFFLTSETSLEGAADLLGISRGTLASTLTASIKLLKKREAEAATGEEALAETLVDEDFPISGEAYLDDAYPDDPDFDEPNFGRSKVGSADVDGIDDSLDGTEL